MTFEEFLEKKKIDLNLFRSTEPDLTREFEFLFQEMGPKSFDHSKKFWFNKLRRQYPAPEIVKSGSEKVLINEIAAQALPLISPSIESSRAVQSPSESGVSVTSPENKSPMGFKPRFKSAQNSPDKNKDPAESLIPDRNEESPKKAAYVPRFKPGTISKTEIKKEPDKPEESSIIREKSNNEDAENNSVKSPLPFKPRFRPGISKPGEGD